MAGRAKRPCLRKEQKQDEGAARNVKQSPPRESPLAERPCLKIDIKQEGELAEKFAKPPPLKGRGSPLPPAEQVFMATAGEVSEATGHQTALQTAAPGEEDSGLQDGADGSRPGDAGDDTARQKRARLVVGLNAVTRSLEHGGLQVGLLCTSSPKLLSQHLMALAATRKVPFATVPGLSNVVAKLLGIKRAMCIGLRVSRDTLYK